MVSKTWKAMLVAAATGSLALTAAAQAPKSQPAKDGAHVGPSSSLTGMSVDQYRMYAIVQLGLNDPALRFNTAQKAEISKSLDTYGYEQKKQDVIHPLAKGERPSPAATTERQSRLTNLDAAVGKVMNDEQRKTWEAGKIARREAVERAARSRPPNTAPNKKN